MACPLALGCHLSTTGGYRAMGETALSIGATTFAFFTRNPRGGTAKAVDPDDARELRELMAANGFGRLVAHAPYTMNLCSAKPAALDFARRALADDLARMESLPGNFYNLHPGSHVGQGTDEGIRLIVEGLNEALVKGQSTTVLLETMVGKGSEIGRSFEELARIIDGVREKQLLGVCLDTCHVWDGGYDVRDGLDGVLDEFDRLIGLGLLRALHLNDSKHARGSRKDRHERIGQGAIGLGAFAALVSNQRLAAVPMILETPNDLAGYAAEISLLRRLAEDRMDVSRPFCGEVG
ncbi:deoxyribonuclease IV [Coriobacteriales bacterium OH1046]|nr:deoxyribonuclease IV [Coriobacteriales bacterium OH1046]